jgi:hypothetical protein
MCWMMVLVHMAFEIELIVQEQARDRSAVGSHLASR